MKWTNATTGTAWFAGVATAALGLLMTAQGCSSSSNGGGNDAGPDTGHGSEGGTTGGMDSSTTPDTGGSEDTGTTGDTGTTSDTGTTGDAGTGEETGTEAGCSGVELTVKNFDTWCTITVNGTKLPDMMSQEVCVPTGTVNLLATAHTPSFMLGPDPWHDTAGDKDGGGDPGTVADGGSSTTVVVGTGAGTACVWACCPSSSDTTDCNVSNQCP